MDMMEQKEMDFPSEEVNFKFKITNLRKTAYATNSPAESDYFQFKVGDLLMRSTSYTEIYEVVAITREAVIQAQCDKWKKSLSSYSSEIKAKQLIEDYLKNGSFGACRIYVKSVLRGEKRITKSKKSSFLEIDNIRPMTYRGFQTADIDTILKHRDNMIKKYDWTVNQATKKRDREIDLKQALISLVDERNPTAVIEVLQEVTEAA